MDSLANTSAIEVKKPKVFIIKKYVKYEEIIKEFCGEEENSDSEKKPKKSRLPKEKRIKLIKYNNKKLSNLEKVEKLKILSKVVRRYRRKIKNIRKKIKQNSDKIFARYLNKKLVKDKKLARKEPCGLSLNNFVNSLRKVKSNGSGEFSQDRKALEDFVNLLASGRLKPDSMQFKIIATQVRMLLEEQKVKAIGKREKTMVCLPENNVVVSKKEFEFYKKAGGDVNVLRAIFGYKPVGDAEEKQDGGCSGKNQGGLFDLPILESLINKEDSDEFCNNLFNTDIASCNNAFIK